MAIGQVTIAKLDGNQGSFAEPERIFLFMGKSGLDGDTGRLIQIGNNSNLDDLLGAEDSELKKQIAAARLNAQSDNWVCYAYAVGKNAEWTTAYYLDILDDLLEKPYDVNIEAAVLCHPVSSKEEVNQASAAAAGALSRFAKFITVMLCTAGPAENESWSELEQRNRSITAGVADERVCVVPLLHGNNLGAVCGRLCNPAVSIADSPMRVATGAVKGLEITDPADGQGTPLTMAVLASLSSARLSVPQWYQGYQGVYWADHMTLAAEASDYQVWENLRVVDYCSRRIRTLAIARIADRNLNSTPRSIAAAKTYFMRPLREAARPVPMGSTEIAATIMPPEDGDIAITWQSKTHVVITVSARPYHCPKKITAYIGLDLSNTEE